MIDTNRVEFPTVLPILPLKNTVVFPHSVLPLTVGRESSVKLIEEALAGTRIIGVLTQRDPNVEHPTPQDVYHVGTVCKIARVMKTPNNALLLWVQGLSRFAVAVFTQQTPYLVAQIEPLESVVEHDIEIEALSKQVAALFQKMLSLMPNPHMEIHAMASSLSDPGHLADFITANLDIEVEAKQQVLETLNVKERLTLVLRLLEEENEILEVGSRIHSRVQEEIGRSTRERILREQMEAIKKELGEEEGPEIEELRRKIKHAKMPKDAEKEALRELDRLAQMHPSSAEYTVSRTYLDWLIALPWSKTTKDLLEIARARQILDEDHYNLEKVKERILEYLAVLKLKRDMKGPILCLVGPPGVGKTSLGRSIARALGRKFVRISLGGVRDEAEIRGHRRTYVGALPGRIIQGLRRANSKNPVFMLDEIDKMSSDFRGDPAAALLEVLDPEQNSNFTDHYLDLPFDLSRVLFITTANVLYTIPSPLLDRMEVLELPGYSEDEKVQIAQRYLIPKQIKAHGLRAHQVEFSDAAIRQIIRDYTHEAGVRNLEREIGAVCRKIAVQVAEKKDRSRRFIEAPDVSKMLGPPKYFSEVSERLTKSGVAIGMVVTQVGGDIVFIEATKMKGKGELKLTGQLGEVMRESAQAALSYIRANAEQLGIDPDFFAHHDIHIHVPEGAIPKDGPSAGVTLVTALVSLLTDTPVPADLAMTGEITLRGKVLPVGGVREKVLAAHRTGIKTVILPKRNEKDLEELPQNVREALRIEFVEEISDVLEIALPRYAPVP
ncbi:MAG: endopeptidase La [Candidatus Bipolaricaulota bacterium]|nr:endopeptidase La [Candidatus Bipolaricaulota bacterium]